VTEVDGIYKNVGKPHNAADARHVDFPKFRWTGAPMVVDIRGVRQGVSELLQAVYMQSRKVSVAVLPQFQS